MSESRLTLEPGGWYALTMYPGYLDGPYCSPIQVKAVRPARLGRLELDYWNVGYAAGVQVMTKTFRVHRRGERHMILDEVDVPDRTTVIEPLTDAWLRSRAPWFNDVRAGCTCPDVDASG